MTAAIVIVYAAIAVLGFGAWLFDVFERFTRKDLS